MAKNGFDIWMDIKNILHGERIIFAVADGLNIALTNSIKNKNPRIIPVLLDDCTIPSVLSGQLLFRCS